MRWSEDSHSSLAKKAAEQEAHIDNLGLRLRDAEAKVFRARNELGVERNRHIRKENELRTAVEDTRKKTTEDILERVCLEAEA